MRELPANCMFNKGTTGCGGTDLALRNDKHTIIAMPFISLVRNKADNDRHRDRVLGVDGSTTIHEIKQYITEYEVWKIAVVYDSLPKVIEAFQEMDINPFNKCFLLVDEYHVLFNQYVFRDKAIRKLLEIATCFEEKTYMSATPLHEESMLKELKDLPIYDVVWPNKREVTVTHQPTSSPQRYTIRLIEDKLDDKIFGNLHIFVNSVKFINSVLNKVVISPDDVKVVCADNEENKAKLNGIKIGKASDAPCKVNFYTSTCFEGCDIFDKEGRSYVISEGRNPNTLYDISTLFIQIIGRIRDSNYRDNITHVTSSSYYKGEVSFEQYKDMMIEEYKTAMESISNYNSRERPLRKEIINQYGKDHFINRFIHVDENYFYSMDENLLNKSLMDYRIKTEIYNKSHHLLTAYKKNGLNIKRSDHIKYSDQLKRNSNSRMKYKDVAEEYHSICSTLT